MRLLLCLGKISDAQLSLGETPHGSLEYNTIFAVGLLLFLITLVMNVMGHAIVRRWGLKYE